MATEQKEPSAQELVNGALKTRGYILQQLFALEAKNPRIQYEIDEFMKRTSLEMLLDIRELLLQGLLASGAAEVRGPGGLISTPYNGRR